MPRRRQRKGAKRTGRRRRRYGRALARIPTLLPSKQVVRLKYCDLIGLDPAASWIASQYTFSANGLYDPDITGTGHQPMGFDQWTALYNKYTVIGSKITVKPAFNNSPESGSYVCGLTVEGLVPTAASITKLMETFPGRMKTVQSGIQIPTFVGKFKPHYWYPNRKLLTDDLLAGTASANPSDQVYYNIYAYYVDQATNATEIKLIVTIDYLVVFTDPIDVSPS